MCPSKLIISPEVSHWKVRQEWRATDLLRRLSSPKDDLVETCLEDRFPFSIPLLSPLSLQVPFMLPGSPRQARVQGKPLNPFHTVQKNLTQSKSRESSKPSVWKKFQED